MRALIPTLTAILIFVLSSTAQEPHSEDLRLFAERLSVLISQKDLDSILALYYFEGTPDNLQQNAVSRWTIFLRQTHFEEQFRGVEAVSIEQFRAARGGVNERTEKYVGSTQIDGVMYERNAPVTGVVLVRFGTACYVYPVGFTTDGRLHLLGKKKTG